MCHPWRHFSFSYYLLLSSRLVLILIGSFSIPTPAPSSTPCQSELDLINRARLREGRRNGTKMIKKVSPHYRRSNFTFNPTADSFFFFYYFSFSYSIFPYCCSQLRGVSTRNLLLHSSLQSFHITISRLNPAWLTVHTMSLFRHTISPPPPHFVLIDIS